MIFFRCVAISTEPVDIWVKYLKNIRSALTWLHFGNMKFSELLPKSNKYKSRKFNFWPIVEWMWQTGDRRCPSLPSSLSSSSSSSFRAFASYCHMHVWDVWCAHPPNPTRLTKPNPNLLENAYLLAPAECLLFAPNEMKTNELSLYLDLSPCAGWLVHPASAIHIRCLLFLRLCVLVFLQFQ